MTTPRPARTWLWVLSVVVAAGLLLATIGLVIRTVDDRSRTTLIVTGVAAGLALSAVALTWLESRRITRQLQSTIDRLAQAEQELRSLLDDLPEAVLSVDESGRVRGVNAKATELTGRAASALIGRPLVDLFSGPVADEVTHWLVSPVFNPLDALTVELPRVGGSPCTVEVTHERARSGGREHVIVRLRDVTEREQSIRALERARLRFQQAFHSAPTGMALVRLDTTEIVDANRSLAEMLLRSVDDLVGRTMRELTHPDDLRAAATHRARLELGITDTYLLDQRYLRSDGEYLWARTRVAVAAGDQADGSIDGGSAPAGAETGDHVALAVMHIEDVTEALRTADQLRWAATHDSLTGLPNRAELLERVDQLLADAPLGTVALLFVDLDNFKNVNDSLGHDIGDRLLTAMARRLHRVMDPASLLGRFGGDEFIVVLRASADVDLFDPLLTAEELRAAIREPVDVEGTELFVTASVGLSVNRREGVSAADLLRDADAAMYRAKGRGRDCVEVYAPGTHETTVLALRTASQLRRGVERGEIVPYYQPIVDLTTLHVVGFEVLARWRHPERGLLSPAEFLPLAEETGMVGAIGEVMLREGLLQLARWRHDEAPFARAYLSVNVGTRQVGDAGFAGLVAEALADSGVPADDLWLEITETALLADVKASTVALRRLRSLGVHLAVDDFGTGYSSLTYLKRFPVEAIKIDKSFVGGLGIDPDDSTIVEAVVNLGHSLGLGVVAEGLETPLQLARLRELRCDRGQGYLHGRPRPAALVEADLTERA